MHRNNTMCSFGCLEYEDQEHIFTKCRPILTQTGYVNNLSYQNIFGNLNDQLQVLPKFYQIEKIRLHMMEHLIDGRQCSQNTCTGAQEGCYQLSALLQKTTPYLEGIRQDPASVTLCSSIFINAVDIKTRRDRPR